MNWVLKKNADEKENQKKRAGAGPGGDQVGDAEFCCTRKNNGITGSVDEDI